MIPSLHAFFGPCDPKYGSWLDMPPEILRMYETMRPRLEALQQLRLHQSLIAAGELMMEEGARAKYIDSLERQAQGGKRVRRPNAAQLERMGIGVRKEPAKDKRKGGDD